MEFRARFLLSGAVWHVTTRCAAGGVPGDNTDVTQDLNNRIRESGDCGTYRGWINGCNGGQGVLIRNPYDAYENGGPFENWKVVPSTFWHNDIVVANTVFPSTGGSDPNNFRYFEDQQWGVTSYNCDCPNEGWNGFFKTSECLVDPGTNQNSPWRYASTGYIIGDAMENLMRDWGNSQSDDWGWGVFYPTDSNAVDWRCRRLEGGYDCPPDAAGDEWNQPGSWVDDDGTIYWDEYPQHYGSGAYEAGNPYADGGGGGTGCHKDKEGLNIIDQTDAFDGDGNNLVMNADCQCNTLFNDDWSHWVQHWIAHAQPKPGFDNEWWLGGSGNLAPFRALDQAACWMNNLRDMINLQNQIWWHRFDWANQLTPETYWDKSDANTQWAYWGWNEIPTSLDQLRPAENHQAIFIHIPSSSCGAGGGDDSVYCLGTEGHHTALENDLDNWVNGPDGFGYLVPGYENMSKRPGSYVVFVREYYDYDNDRWRKWFYCENWTGPLGKYKIVSWSMGDGDDTGGCYIDKGSMYHRFYGSATGTGKLKHTMDAVV